MMNDPYSINYETMKKAQSEHILQFVILFIEIGGVRAKESFRVLLSPPFKPYLVKAGGKGGKNYKITDSTSYVLLLWDGWCGDGR